MSDTNTDNPVIPPAPVEKLGVTLRKAREVRGLTVEAVARSLKLNPKYIEALEADHYAEFPAQPYIRVYLKALAKHLNLDADHVLKTYRRQQGIDLPDGGAETNTRIDIAATKKDKATPPWPAIAGLIAVVAVLALVAQRMNPPPATTSAADPVQDTSALAPVPDTLLDTLDSTSVRSDSVASATDSAAAAVAKTPADTMRLVLAPVKDSVWAAAFTDGKGWSGFVYSGRTRTLKAIDSIDVQVGHNANTTYTLNGKPVTPSSLAGVAAFRVRQSGTSEWTLAEWRKTYKDRAQ